MARWAFYGAMYLLTLRLSYLMEMGPISGSVMGSYRPILSSHMATFVWEESWLSSRQLELGIITNNQILEYSQVKFRLSLL